MRGIGYAGLLLLCSCYAGVHAEQGEGTATDGTIGGGTAQGDDDGTAGESGEPSACTSTDSIGAPVPMRRLTALQVRRSVSDILGVDTPLAVDDEKLFTFRSNVSSAVDFVGARGYLDFAEASVAAADLSPCDAAGDACDAWLFDDVGRRLFRRSLDDDERTGYAALFAEGEAEDGAREGARWVLEAMLQSPSFLYMDEVVDEEGWLDDTSIASRLALTLWGSNPDGALLDRAEAGDLSTPELIRAEAERMLDDPRSVGGLTDFVDQWLRLERLNDPDARPDLEALGAETLVALRGEPVQLFRMLVAHDHAPPGLGGEGNIATLLTTHDTVRAPLLAELYGDDIVGNMDGTSELDPERRAGILSLPGVMAALSHAEGTSPTLRGYAVLANFLCAPPPPPPPGVDVTLPEGEEGQTTRERLEAHFSEPICAACHAPMDGMGFAFESIDWLGRFRAEEFGDPIDDSSTFPLDGEEVTVDGPPGLAAALAESDDVAECVVRQWASYGAGTPDKDEVECLVEQLAVQAAGEAGLREMILGFVVSDWYRRGPEAPP